MPKRTVKLFLLSLCFILFPCIASAEETPPTVTANVEVEAVGTVAKNKIYITE